MRILKYLIRYTVLSPAIAGVSYVVAPLSTANPNQVNIFIEQKAKVASAQIAAAFQSIVNHIFFLHPQPVLLAGVSYAIHIHCSQVQDLH